MDFVFGEMEIIARVSRHVTSFKGHMVFRQGWIASSFTLFKHNKYLTERRIDKWMHNNCCVKLSIHNCGTMEIGVIEHNLTWPLIFKSNYLDSQNGKIVQLLHIIFSKALGLGSYMFFFLN